MPCCPGWTVDEGRYDFTVNGSAETATECNYYTSPPRTELDMCAQPQMQTLEFQMRKEDEEIICECVMKDMSPPKLCCTVRVEYGYMATGTLSWTCSFYCDTRYCDGVHYCYGGYHIDNFIGYCTNLILGSCIA